MRPAGPRAWLVETADVAGLHAAIEAAPFDLVDVVPAAATVLVVVADPRQLAAVGEWLGSVPERARADSAAAVVEIPVRYDGPDLGAVARAAGLDEAAVVDRHRSVTYRCAFCGFAPGFAYLTGLPPELHVPRRATPRTRVPAGAVAIAAGYTAVYPSPSPGGWHLIGSADRDLWDPDRDPPAMVRPGMLVRFVEDRG